MNYPASIPTRVAIYREGGNWNPVFNTITVGPGDESNGSFLVISGEDENNEGSTINIDWEEWDELCQVVAEHRNKWEWKAE